MFHMSHTRNEVSLERSAVGNTKLRHAAVTIFSDNLDIVRTLSQDERVRYVIAQQEVCPDTKRDHLQCYFQFTRPINFNTLKKLLPGAHIEKARGTAEENRQYCSKRDSRKAGTEPFEAGSICSQGKRKDLEAFKEAIDAGKSEAEIASDNSLFCTWAKYPNLYPRYKQAQILPRDRERPPEVSVYVGSTGVGKTKRVFDEHKNDVYMKDGTKWWNGYTGQRCILLDDISVHEHWRIEELLRLLDRYPYQGQTKGGYVNVNSPFIAITSNVPLEDLYGAANEEQLQALNRRITNKISL